MWRACFLASLAAAVLAGCNGSEQAQAEQAGGQQGTVAATPKRANGTCARPYTDSSPWNTPIGPDPDYHSDSDAYIADLEGELTSDPTQYTTPVYEVTARTPRQTVELTGLYSYVSADNTMLNRLEPGAIDLPIPAGTEPGEGNDAEVILYDPATGDEWGLWQLRRTDDGRWTAVNGYHYNTNWSGVPPTEEGGRPFGSRGAGVPHLVGLVRPCEIARGRIEHALGFGYDQPSGEHVYPASKSDGTGDDSDLPEGSRLQLDPSITEREIREWGCRGPCMTVARALQEYGMYVLDNSGRPKLAFEDERTAGWNGLIDENTVRPIPLSAFKVVEPLERPGG
jgi:hypothetical protein